jgi:hypothetical protein
VSPHPDIEALEARTPEALDHARECGECARELRWLEAERALVKRRPQPPVAHLWPGVEQRIEERKILRPHWAWRASVVAAGLAAAASVLIVALVKRPAAVPVAAQQREEPYKPDAKTMAALDRAEADYRDAAKVLEGEYARLRPRLDPKLASRWDETLTRAHTELGEARAVAGEDVNARMQVLDGYAGYLRSLRNLVQQSEEANP